MHKIVVKAVETGNSFDIDASMTCTPITGLVLIDSAIKNYARRFDVPYDMVVTLLNNFNRVVKPQAVIDVGAIKRQFNKD